MRLSARDWRRFEAKLKTEHPDWDIEKLAEALVAQAEKEAKPEKIGSKEQPVEWKNPNGITSKVYRDEEGTWHYKSNLKGEWFEAEKLPSDWYKKLVEEKSGEGVQQHASGFEEEELGLVTQNLSGHELTKFLDQKKDTIISSYKGGYSTSAIAKSLGLPQDSNSRNAIRKLLRDAGVYVEPKQLSGDNVIVSKKPLEAKSKLPKQAQEILKIIQNNPNITVNDIIAQMGSFVKTKQPMVRIWAFYRNRLVAEGYIGVKGDKTETSVSEHKPAVSLPKSEVVNKYAEVALKFMASMADGDYAFKNMMHAEHQFYSYNKAVGIDVYKAKQMLGATISGWTGSSHATGGQIMKQIAAEYYGKDIKQEPKIPSDLEGAKVLAEKHKQAFLAQKEFTKAWVKKFGATHVYRGVHGKLAQEIKAQIQAGKKEIEFNPNVLSSWSDSQSKASDFAGDSGVVLKMKCDPEHVWSCYGSVPFSSFQNYPKEREYIMGHSEPTFKIKASDITVKGSSYVYPKH